MDPASQDLLRARREPPPFRRCSIRSILPRGERLTRLVLEGPELDGLEAGLPAASVRMLLPRSPDGELELPTWTGNEFRHDDDRRPAIRTLTPLRVDIDEHGATTLAVEIVRHEHGALADWLAVAGTGSPVAISGTGRGYAIDLDASSFLLLGDESAIPAISTLLEALPETMTVDVVVEIASTDGRVGLPPHPGATVRFVELAPAADPGSAMLAALVTDPANQPDRIWVAGEAAGVQRIRRHLFDELGTSRSRATVRGYWKLGRAES